MSSLQGSISLLCKPVRYLPNLRENKMKNVLLIVVLSQCLTGCVALVAGAAGATIANPKGAGQVVSNTGKAVQDLGEKVQSSADKKAN